MNGRGPSPASIPVSITPNTLPGIPSNLFLHAVDRGFSATWSKSTRSTIAVEAYILVYKQSAATYPTLSGTGSAITCPATPRDATRGCIRNTGTPLVASANFAGLTNGEAYDVKVLAVGALGASPFTPELSVTPIATVSLVTPFMFTAGNGITYTVPDLAVPAVLNVRRRNTALNLSWGLLDGYTIEVPEYLLRYRAADTPFPAVGADNNCIVYKATTLSSSILDVDNSPENPYPNTARAGCYRLTNYTTHNYYALYAIRQFLLSNLTNGVRYEIMLQGAIPPGAPSAPGTPGGPAGGALGLPMFGAGTPGATLLYRPVTIGASSINLTVSDHRLNLSWTPSEPEDAEDNEAPASTINYYLLIYRNKTANVAYPTLVANHLECRHTAGGPFIQNNNQRGCLVTTDAVPRLTIDNLTNGAEYAVKIVAVSTVGASDFPGSQVTGRGRPEEALVVDGATNFTDELSAFVGRPPLSPNTLELSAGANSFTASWEPVSTLPLGDPANGGFAVSKYILVYRNVSDIGHAYPDLVVNSSDVSCPTVSDAANSGCIAVTSGDPVDSTLNVGSLTNGKKYRARVLAVNEKGASPWSSEAQVIPTSNLASAVRDVTFDITNTSIELNWLAPTTDGGSSITGYLLLYKSGSTPYPTLSGAGTDCTGVTNSATAGCELITGLTHTLTSLTTGSLYEIHLRAITANGLGAVVSITATPGALPDAIDGTSIQLVGSDGSVDAQWDAPNANGFPIQKYIALYRRADSVYRALPATNNCPTSPVNDVNNGCIEVAPTRPETVIYGLQNDQRYSLQIAAVNMIGLSAYSAEQEFIPSTVPSAPRNLRLYQGNGRLSVSWNDPEEGNTAGVTYLVVYRRAPATAYTQLASSGVACSAGSNTADQGCIATSNAATSLDLSGLLNGSEYTVRLRAINVIGAGDWSLEESATPDAVASEVQNFQLRAAPRRLLINWTPPLSDGGSPITGYIFLYRSGIATFPLVVNDDCSGIYNQFVSGCQVVAAGERSLEWSDITPATDYSVMLRAITARGLGSATVANIRSVGVPGRMAANSLQLSPLNRSLRATWRAPTRNAASITRYILIYRNVTTNADYPELDGEQGECKNLSGAVILRTEVNGCLEVAANLTQFDLTGLQELDNYAVRVAAVNAAGRAPFTMEERAVVGAIPTAPLIRSLQRINNGLRVMWAPPVQIGSAPITRYVILYRQAGTRYPVLRDTDNQINYTSCRAFINTANRGCVQLDMPAALDVTIGSLRNVNSYNVKLYAVNAFGATRAPNDWSVGPPATPDVTNLELLARTATSFRAEWLSPSATNGVSVARYVLLYRNVTSSQAYPALSGTGSGTNCGSAGPVADSGCRTTSTQIAPSITLTGLTNGQRYAVKVFSVNIFGVGNDSAEQEITVTVPNAGLVPSAPTDAAFTLALTDTPGSIRASWVAPAANGSAITKYVLVYRNLTAGNSYLPVNESGCAAALSLVADYGCIEVTGATSATISSLVAFDVRYGLRVLAINANGASPFTQSKSIQMGTRPAVVEDVAVRHVPSNDNIEVHWSVLSEGDESGYLPLEYVVEYRMFGNSVWIQHAAQEEEGSIISGLDPQQTYELRVYATNAVTSANPSVLADIQANAAPVFRMGIPANLGNTLTNSARTGDITLTWDVRAGGTRYELEEARSADAGTTWSLYSTLLRADPAVNSERLTARDGEWHYKYRVRTCAAPNHCSLWHESSAIDLSFPAITGVGSDAPMMAVAIDADVPYTVSWDTYPHAAHYEVQQKVGSGDWGLSIRVTGDSRAYTNKLGFASHFYRVRACNADDDCGNWSNAYEIATPAIPSAPMNLSLRSGTYSDVYDNEYVVEWTTSLTSALYEHELQECNDGGGGCDITAAEDAAEWRTLQAARATSMSINQSQGGNYNYRVRTCNGNGCGDWAGLLTVRLDIPSQPILTSDETPDPNKSYDGSYTLSWTASAGVTRYELQECSWLTTLGTPACTAGEADNAVNWLASGIGGAGTLQLTAPTTSYTPSARAIGNTYIYRARSCVTVAGTPPRDICSGWSPVFRLTTAVLDAPQNLRSDEGEREISRDGSYALSWNTVPGAASYHIEAHNYGAGAFSALGAAVSAPTTTSSLIDAGFNGEFAYRVRACATMDTSLCSAYSAPLTVRVERCGQGVGDNEDDPYIICTYDQLKSMRNDLDKHYKLGSNVDASETCPESVL